VLLYKNQIGTTLEKAEMLTAQFDRLVHWYSIYKDKNKVGYAKTVFEKVADELIIEHFQTMNIDKKVLIEETLRSLSKSDYSVKSFEYSSRELMNDSQDSKTYKITGEVAEDSILFFFEMKGKRKSISVPIKKGSVYLPTTFIPALLRLQPAQNSTYSIPILNILKSSIDQVSVTLQEIIPLTMGNNIMSIYKFKMGDIYLWSSEDGTIIKQALPQGINIYRDEQNIAEDPTNRIIIDPTEIPFFKSNLTIPSPEKIRSFKARISGIVLEPDLYLNSRAKLDDNIISVTYEDKEVIARKSYKIPIDDGGFRSYLEPDAWVRSDNKILADSGKAHAQVADYDACNLADYLTGYLYNLITPAIRFTLPDSSELIGHLVGDHFERTILFATYARAAGLPTRLVGGLVYRNGFFYYHIWPEVWLTKWIPADPSLYQFPADATHIPLVTGSARDLAKMTDSLKNIKIEILEAS